MFAFKHKETGEFLLVTMVSDAWGNNSMIQLVEPKWIDEYQDVDLGVYCQKDRQVLQDILDNGRVGEYDGVNNAGHFKVPMNYVDMSQYEIVELRIV